MSLSDVLKPTGFEEASKILTGNEMAERMRLINITASNFPKFEVIHGSQFFECHFR